MLPCSKFWTTGQIDNSPKFVVTVVLLRTSRASWWLLHSRTWADPCENELIHVKRKNASYGYSATDLQKISKVETTTEYWTMPNDFVCISHRIFRRVINLGNSPIRQPCLWLGVMRSLWEFGRVVRFPIHECYVYDYRSRIKVPHNYGYLVT